MFKPSGDIKGHFASPSYIISFLSLFIFTFVSAWLIFKGSFVFEGQRGFTLFDDAMISMRYAYNFAHHGVIEWSKATGRVEGLTNIGWMLIMSIAIKFSSISSAPLFVSLISGIFMSAGIVYATGKDSKFANLSRAFGLSALAGSFSLITWSIRGFETGLIFFLLSLILIKTSKRSSKLSAREKGKVCLAIALGVLTRDDLAVCLIVYGILLFVSRLLFLSWVSTSLANSRLLITTTCLALCSKIAFRYAYFNEFLPNTYYLKVYGHNKIDVLGRGLTALGGNLLSVFAPLLLVIVILYLISPKTWMQSIKRVKEIDSHLLILSFLIYSVYVGGDAWEQSRVLNRFTCIVLPFILLNFLQFVHSYEKTSTVTFPLSLKRCGLAAPIYLLLLPAYKGLGEIYEQIVNSLKGVDGLDQFNQTSAREDWMMVGFFVFVMPHALKYLYHNLWAEKELRMETLTHCIALMLVIKSLFTIINSELRDTGSFLHIQDDSKQALLSLGSKNAIPPGSRVVSMWAGTFPYYRPDVDFVDPLGKMDKYIARTKPRHSFYPGHTKWNWSYTLNKYQPDIVIGQLAYFNRTGLWTDKVVEWENYFQDEANLIRRKKLAEE